MQNRDEWLRARKAGIGGSDAAAVLRRNPWRSALECFRDKVSQDLEQQDSPRLRFGRWAEDYIRAEYARDFGHELDPGVEMMQHPTEPYMLANTDGMTPEGWVWEAKTVGGYAFRYWSRDGGPPRPPVQYWIQCQHYMAVTGAPRAILSALVLDGDTAVQHFEIERDDEFIDGTLIPGIREFWSRVEAGRDAPDPFQYAPPPDGSASAARVLSKLYPDPDPEESVELPDDLQSMALEFVALGEVAHKANATARKAADERRRIASEFTTYLGPAQIGSFSDGSYVRRSKVGRSGHTIRFYEVRDDG